MEWSKGDENNSFIFKVRCKILVLLDFLSLQLSEVFRKVVVPFKFDFEAYLWWPLNNNWSKYVSEIEFVQVWLCSLFYSNLIISWYNNNHHHNDIVLVPTNSHTICLLAPGLEIHGSCDGNSPASLAWRAACWSTVLKVIVSILHQSGNWKWFVVYFY